VQLGEVTEETPKPKRASLPRGTDPSKVDLETALTYLSLPREIGRHPEDDEPVVAGIGRFGPYVRHGNLFASLRKEDDVLAIELPRAIELLELKKASPRRGRFRKTARSGGATGDETAAQAQGGGTPTRTAARKTSGRKTGARRASGKTAVHKTVVKKAPAKKATARKTVAAKTATGKRVAKKTATSRSRTAGTTARKISRKTSTGKRTPPSPPEA
jgi:DNA topoisomerase-1